MQPATVYSDGGLETTHEDELYSETTAADAADSKSCYLLLPRHVVGVERRQWEPQDRLPGHLMTGPLGT